MLEVCLVLSQNSAILAPRHNILFRLDSRRIAFILLDWLSYFYILVFRIDCGCLDFSLVVFYLKGKAVCVSLACQTAVVSNCDVYGNLLENPR